MEQLQEGDYVTILKDPIKNEKGYIRYLGELEGRPGTFYGIHLDNKVGSHNGTLQGKEYFTCPEGHGLFITGNHLKKTTMVTRDPNKKSTKVTKDEPKPQKLKTSASSAAVVQKAQPQQQSQYGSNQTTKQTTLKRNESKKETVVKRLVEEQIEERLSTLEAEEVQEPQQLIKQQSEPEPQFLDHQQELESVRQQYQALKIVANDYKLENKSLKKKVEQLEQELTENLEDLDSYEKLIMECEQLKSDKDIMTLKLQEFEAANQSLQQQVSQLQFEKELADLEIEEALVTCGANLQVGNQDSSEVVLKNAQLQKALAQLKQEYDEYKQQKITEIQQYQIRLEAIPSLNEKAMRCAKLESQVKKLTEENQELCQRVDESQALQEMIEKMTETLMKKDDLIEELRNQIKTINEEKKLDQELISTLLDESNSLEKSLNDMQFKLDQANAQINNNANDLQEKDLQIQRLKVKVAQLNKQVDQQRLEEDNTQNEHPKKTFLDEINIKNQELISQQRDTYKKYMKVALNNIEIRNQIALKGIIIYKSLPQDYCTKLKFNLLEPVILVRKLSEKSLLVADEFLQQLENQSDKFIKEELQDLGFWMLNAHKSLYQLSDLCNIFTTYLQNQTDRESLEKVARNGILLNQFKIADTLVDMIIQSVQNEKISTQLSLSELQFAIQRINDDLSNLEIQEGAVIESLLNQIIFKYSYSIFNFKVIINQSTATTLQQITVDQLIDTLIQRCKELSKQLRYGRQCWGGYFNRKNEKFLELINYLQQLLQQDLNKLELDQYQQYISCQGESVSQPYRDRCVSIVHLLNQINQQFEEQNINEEFLSNKPTLHSYAQTSLWAQWQKELKSQLSDISYTIESEKRLKDDLQKLQQEKTQIYSDCVALRKNKEALENRVVDLQIKADRVQVLENEKQRHLEKIKGFNEASELTRKEIDNLENKLKESEDIRKQLEEQISLYQQQQPKNSFLDQLQGRNFRKSGTLLIQSSNNLDQESTFNPFQELTMNKGIEAVLLKENQQLKLYKLRDEILSITSSNEKPQIEEKLLQIRKLKMKQLKSMALNEKFDARNQAAKFYVKQNGMKLTNTVLMDTLQAIIAV
ncbi:unnamed protein product (macronuclear) [Paramecium tetraurelia]|uniref:CAP-Gly domain-containing protein n=1 Tax=Paramecium tetraurelia TaxID=5888 RepID=A0CKR3_PARTE|nr:uncharacterized protein GSPATT00001094001 [Paramecium tetraurelia]CAK71380.1 unnamed protein product [Paramecium tetraurelia]|eukprot:XP_001438777.1 hypothetical protein (macronuclear) [Paramecium tetraurelia strain d4-2]